MPSAITATDGLAASRTAQARETTRKSDAPDAAASALAHDIGPFQTTLERAGADVKAVGQSGGQAGKPTSKMAKAHRDFEVVVLQNMIETMLPDSADTVFGKGVAGKTWKSMLAEKLAQQVALSGDLGLADRMATTAPMRGQPEVNFIAPASLAPAGTVK